jgi:predicted nucleotide-binding protein
MAKRNSPSGPVRPHHSIDEKRLDVQRLARRLKALEEFNPASVMQRFKDPKVIALEAAIDEALASVFGNGTAEYNRYRGAARLDNGPVSAATYVSGRGNRGLGIPFDDAAMAQQYVAEGRQRAMELLRQAINGLEEDIADDESLSEPSDLAYAKAQLPSQTVKPNRSTNKIFVVHGHAGEPREAVARFIERLGFEPIILHEQANQGRTVIEKFEAHSDVGFAVVLLTPDDVGGPTQGQQQPRARQNVVLELGYFIGRLSRARVCALKAGELELPSDIIGIVWTPYDAGWKQALAKELEAAGYDIDWNRVMRS